MRVVVSLLIARGSGIQVRDTVAPPGTRNRRTHGIAGSQNREWLNTGANQEDIPATVEIPAVIQIPDAWSTSRRRRLPRGKKDTAQTKNSGNLHLSGAELYPARELLLPERRNVMRKYTTRQINRTSTTRSTGEARRCTHCGALAPRATVEPSVGGL